MKLFVSHSLDFSNKTPLIFLINFTLLSECFTSFTSHAPQHHHPGEFSVCGSVNASNNYKKGSKTTTLSSLSFPNLTEKNKRKMTAAVTPDLALQLQSWHLAKLALYDKVLGSASERFFDVVVITSADAEQTATYEANIEILLEQGRIPKQTKYLVFPDPPGRKVGCGGATFYVLDELRTLYGAAYSTKSVLLIHAGGYSKRLPNHSHCGKIYSLLPVASPQNEKAAMSMLELKLASFAHVATQIPSTRGGVFVTCSDDIIFYDHSLCDFSKPGFIALGHPGSVSIGKDHGVFVLENTEGAGIQTCKKFIHKYPIEQQRAEGAVVGKTADGEDEVFTDSCYFFSTEVSEVLLTLFETTLKKQILAEVDAYGDFMQCVGSARSDAFLTNFGNTAKDDDEERRNLIAVRTALYDALKPFDLHCLRLPGSRFYHVGTMKEALHHFCSDEGFLTCLGKINKAAPSCTFEGTTSSICKIESLVSSDATISGPSVLEFCRVPANVKVGAGSILSGVTLPEGTVLPPKVFLQTLPVRKSALGMEAGETDVAYVSHILGTEDDIKKASEDIKLFGKPVSKYLKVWRKRNIFDFTKMSFFTEIRVDLEQQDVPCAAYCSSVV